MSMPAETADGGALECKHCGATFDDEPGWGWHLYIDHAGDMADLTD